MAKIDKTKQKLYNIVLDIEFLEELKEYQYQRRLDSLAAAIKHLLKLALNIEKKNGNYRRD